jgi:hypothetical protein
MDDSKLKEIIRDPLAIAVNMVSAWWSGDLQFVIMYCTVDKSWYWGIWEDRRSLPLERKKVAL